MDWSIDRDADEPIQDQVEELLRHLITKDEYKKGKLLPGEKEISELLDISRNTVRAAMRRLVEDGLIIRKKGFGSVVNRKKIDTNLQAWINLIDEIKANADRIRTYEKDLSWILPPTETVNVFDVDPHIQIPELKRVVGDDTGPIAQFLSYFHPRVGLDEEETFEGRLYEDVLEPKYGVSPATSDEQIETEMPDNDLKEILAIERDLPILYRERVISDESDDPFQIDQCYYRSDRFRFNIEMTRDEAAG